MQFQLEQLEYQRKAIDAAVRIFQGQQPNTFDLSYVDEIQMNNCNLSPDEIAANVRAVAAENGVADAAMSLSPDADYCIEMETGTGKTLVYLRTIYELHQKIGFTKFIIIVPSVAIREGVVATFDMFKDQLAALYGFTPTFFEYDSKKLNLLKHFIGDTRPQIMVMTLQSFAADDRIINQTERDDSFQDQSYLAALGRCRPILFMDEPQEGMDTENSVARLKNLNPLACFRYSATHKVLKNLLYRLTPGDSYRQSLVKKIEILNVAERNDEATLKIELADVRIGVGDPKVKLKAWKKKANGKFDFTTTNWLSARTNLGEVTGNVSYRDYTIDRIVGGKLAGGVWRVSFTNGTEIVQGARAGDSSGIFREQLHWFIRRHFERKAELAAREIKPLALCFIDRVANYTDPEGIIRRIFREEYPKIVRELQQREATPEEIEAVQGSYFAQGASGEYTDNESAMLRNKEMFDRILRDKETLLSFSEPIEFIFSHSALGVGWDNPNVFTIATLNNSYSEIKKRQEIGRGLRICRNQAGQRVHDADDTPEGKEINVLTVIPNESYETFLAQYQAEIIEQYGSADAGGQLRHRPKGKPRPKIVRRKKAAFESAAFKEFWKRLSRRTDYTVKFDENEVIERAAAALEKIDIREYRADITLTRMDSLDADDVSGTKQAHDEKTLEAVFSPLDVVEELSEQTSLSHTTVFRIINKLTTLDRIARNPPQWIQEAAQRIRFFERDEMLRALQYTPTGEAVPLDILLESFPTFQPTEPTPQRGVYDHAICDSETVEKPFARAADANAEVVCFLKLPADYKIPTPIGDYEPDWGIVMKRTNLRTGTADDYYFVVETKGTNELNDQRALTEDERYKILCAQKHFAALGVELNYVAPVRDWQSFLSGVNL